MLERAGTEQRNQLWGTLGLAEVLGWGHYGESLGATLAEIPTSRV